MLPKLLRSFDVDPTTVLARAGLGAQALNDPEAVIPYTSMGMLLDVAVEQTGCEHLGLLIGQQVSLASLGIIGRLMQTAPVLRIALQDLMMHQYRHAQGAAAYLLEREGQAVFGYAVYQPDVRAITQIHDGAAAAAFGIVRELLGAEALEDIKVSISRAQPADLASYTAFFGVTPSFDAAHTGVSMPSEWLDRPTSHRKAAQRARLEAQVQEYQPAGEHDLITQVRRLLRIGLMTGQTSGPEVAERVGMSYRTLHRRLVAMDTHFQRLLDETRASLAKQLLAETRLSGRDISLIVGFRNAPVFTRSFTEWTGTLPSEWRRFSKSR